MSKVTDYEKWLSDRIDAAQVDCEKFYRLMESTENADARSLYHALSIEYAQKADTLRLAKAEFVEQFKGDMS